MARIERQDVRNLYVNIRFLPDNELAVKQYIHKSERESKARAIPPILRLDDATDD